MKSYSQGFTLVELAVVVVIVGALAATGLAAFTSQLALANVRVTRDNESTIRNALLAYLGSNRRLPCPATNTNGLETRNAGTPGACTGHFGLVPYQTLGLSKKVAMDGWENFISYAVSPQWTVTFNNNAPTNTTSNNSAQAFNVGDPGELQIRQLIPLNNPSPPVSNLAALLISHGINGLGAYTSKGTQNAAAAAGTDEAINAIPAAFTPPVNFIQREYTDEESANGPFDDVVLQLTPNDLIFPLREDGSFRTAEGEWEYQKNRIQDLIIGFMLTSSTCEIPTTADLTGLLAAGGISATDPWGISITNNYARLTCNMNSSGWTNTTPVCGPKLPGTNILYRINIPSRTVIGPTNSEIIGNDAYAQIITTRCPSL